MCVCVSVRQCTFTPRALERLASFFFLFYIQRDARVLGIYIRARVPMKEEVSLWGTLSLLGNFARVEVCRRRESAMLCFVSFF